MPLPFTADFLKAAASTFELNHWAVFLQVAEELPMAHQFVATFQRALEGLQAMAIASAQVLNILLVGINLKTLEVPCPLILNFVSLLVLLFILIF